MKAVLVAALVLFAAQVSPAAIVLRPEDGPLTITWNFEDMEFAGVGGFWMGALTFMWLHFDSSFENVGDLHVEWDVISQPIDRTFHLPQDIGSSGWPEGEISFYGLYAPRSVELTMLSGAAKIEEIRIQEEQGPYVFPGGTHQYSLDYTLRIVPEPSQSIAFLVGAWILFLKKLRKPSLG
jgi:hypothetical protein